MRFLLKMLKKDKLTSVFYVSVNECYEENSDQQHNRRI